VEGERFRRLLEAALLTTLMALGGTAETAVTAADGSADVSTDAAARPESGGASGGASGGPSPQRTSLAIRMVNDAGAPDAALDTAMREAEAIWATAGLRLIWTDAAGETLIDEVRRGDVVFVVVRAEIAPTQAAAALGRRAARGRVMGRVLFEGRRRANLIDVSLTSIAASIAGEKLFKRDVTPLDEAPRHQVLGRALGRVIAHELGHWLHGSGHKPGGLMAPSLSSGQLVTPRAPALPGAWLANKRSREAISREVMP
jgi:hypothetical protein